MASKAIQFLKNKKFWDIAAIAAFLLAVFLIFVLISASAENTDDTESTSETTASVTAEVTESEETTTAETEPAQTDDGFGLTLEQLETGDTSWAYFIVNRTNPIPEGYDDNLEFEQFVTGGGYYYIDARITDYAQCMVNDAARDGVTLYACSIYRTYASQTGNFNNRLKAYAQANYDYATAYAATAGYIAVPGTSEHQTGLAIDFITPEYMSLDEGFENTEAYKWLSENSYKYGFIMRYPSSKSAETGINYEPWHFRFIGFEYAEDIYNSGLCLEEYMALDENVELNPMAPLNIPAKPAWYDSYIPKETDQTTEDTSADDTVNEGTNIDSDETDSMETESSETDFADTELDIFDTEEEDTLDIDTDHISDSTEIEDAENDTDQTDISETETDETETDETETDDANADDFYDETDGEEIFTENDSDDTLDTAEDLTEQTDETSYDTDDNSDNESSDESDEDLES